MARHFLTGCELGVAELDAVIDRAGELKAAPLSSRALERRSVALLFEHPSTRTRLSFEAGIHELGGHPIVLRPGDMQLARGESLGDTALVLSRHVAAIGVRTGPDAMLAELADHAAVPVINMLTTLHHPCQALADLLTVRETFGALAGLRLAYVGDGNNVARSFALLGARAGAHVAVASPPGHALVLDPPPAAGARAGETAGTAEAPTSSHGQIPPSPEERARISLHLDPREAVAGAHAVYTDVWVSMNDDAATAAQRRRALEPYRLDDALLDHAAPDAVALHCLPAHPGEEITAEVLHGPRQRIWEQAENRRHAHKALLELLLA
jgi:ornithine carbamoyltransferase